MNWDDLRYVLSVARLRTLVAAGREPDVDATTVGRRILAIETQLGARLFDRTGEGFALTHTGEIALAHAEEIELETLALQREVQGSDTRVEGPADIAIRASQPTHPDAVGRRLGSCATAAYVARGVEIAETPALIGFPRELDETGIARALRERFPHGRVVARANTEGHVLALVRAGTGIGLIDCFAGDAEPLLRRADAQPPLISEMWAVVHAAMRRATRVRAVLDFLSEIVAEEAALLEGRAAQSAS